MIRASILSLLLILGVWSALAMRNLTVPFENSMHGANGAFYSLVGRNFQRYGLLALRGMMCIEPGSIIDEPAIYAHHPPMIGWLVWASFALFGEGEWQARMVALVLAGASLVLLHWFLREALPASVWPALLATLLTAVTPLWAYYSTMPDPQGAGVLVALFGALWATARWLRRQQRADLVLATLFLMFGYLFDWPAFVGGGLIALCIWSSRVPGRWRAGLLVGGGAMLVGLAIVTWLVFFHRGKLPPLTEAFVSRTASGLEKGEGVGSAFEQILIHHLRCFVLPMSLAGVLATLWLLARRRTGVEYLLLVTLGMAIAHVVMFLEGAKVHDYWQIYLVPGLAIPIAWLVDRMLSAPPPNRWAWRVIAALLAIAAWSTVAADELVRSANAAAHEEAVVLEQMGATMSQLVPPDKYVVTSTELNRTLLYYSDRKIKWKTPVTNLRMLFQTLGTSMGAILVGPDDELPLQTAGVALRGPFQVGRYRLWIFVLP